MVHAFVVLIPTFLQIHINLTDQWISLSEMHTSNEMNMLMLSLAAATATKKMNAASLCVVSGEKRE
jgi:hypothetical protein